MSQSGVCFSLIVFSSVRDAAQFGETRFALRESSLWQWSGWLPAGQALILETGPADCTVLPLWRQRQDFRYFDAWRISA
jgi:hypothetical protein